MFNTTLKVLGIILLTTLVNNLFGQNDQLGFQVANTNTWGSINITKFLIEGNVAPECDNSQNLYWVRDISDPHNDVWMADPATLFAIPGGNGQQSFTVEVAWAYGSSIDCGVPDWDLLIDGDLCDTCVIETELVPGTFKDCDFLLGTGSSGTQRITINHFSGDAWDKVQEGVQEFALRASNLTTYAEIRFGTIAVGTSYTDVLGYFETPQAPLYILRDPPGDGSYSSISTTENTCLTRSVSVTTDNSVNAYYKAKLGVEGSVGLIVMTDYEIFAELGISLTAGQKESEELEYQTCFETTETYTTPSSGLPEDVFIGSAIRYAYGVGKIIARDEGCDIIQDARFAMTPVNVLSSYTYTESFIKENTIPTLQSKLDTLDPSTQDYLDTENQLNVWIQTLAMNNSIKAAAPEAIQREINGGGQGQGYKLTQSTSETQSVDMDVYLEGNLSLDFGFYFGGSGVGFGAALNMRTNYGSSQSSSSSSTNSMEYWLEDDDRGANDGDDKFNVIIGRDPVFGTFTFLLDSTLSRTSCPYEGGYQLDQPELRDPNSGADSMVLRNVPNGQPANFEFQVCNNSNRDRPYNLKLDETSNSSLNAIVSAAGTAINNKPDGLSLGNVPAGSCITVEVSVKQMNLNRLNYPRLRLTLTPACSEEENISSSFYLSAYFDNMTSVEERKDLLRVVDLYPNPAYNEINLSFFMENPGQAEIQIYDLMGKRVWQQKNASLGHGVHSRQIFVDHLPSGIYSVGIRTGEAMTKAKLMITH